MVSLASSRSAPTAIDGITCTVGDPVSRRRDLRSGQGDERDRARSTGRRRRTWRAPNPSAASRLRSTATPSAAGGVVAHLRHPQPGPERDEHRRQQDEPDQADPHVVPVPPLRLPVSQT